MRTHKLVNTDRSSPPSAFYTYPLFFYPSIFVYPLLFLHLSSVSKSPSVLLFFLLLHIYIFLNPLHPHLSLNHYHPSAAGFLLQRHPPPPSLYPSLSIPLSLSLSPPHPIFLPPRFPQKGNHCTRAWSGTSCSQSTFVSDSTNVLWGMMMLAD